MALSRPVRGRAGLEAEVERAAAFRMALRGFLRRTESVAIRNGLTTQRYDLLLMIGAAPGRQLRVTQLCDLLHLQQPAVTELVKRTEAAGLIERNSSPEDGRISLLRLTSEGEQRLLSAFADLGADRDLLVAAFRELDERFRATASQSAGTEGR